MSITELSMLPHGTRVKVKRGNFPTDPELVGRTGVVVEHSPYYPHKIEVSLDGDPRVHTFAPDEIEVVSEPEELDALPEDRKEARRRLVRP